MRNKYLVQERVANREIQGDVWDNCQMFLNKMAEETQTNCKEMIQYTAGFVWFLNIPPPRALESKMYGEAYRLLVQRQIGCVQLACKVVYKELDYTTLTPFNVFDLEGIREMWPIRAFQSIEWVLRKHWPKLMKRSNVKRSKEFSKYLVEPKEMDVFSVPVMKLDETKTEDTGFIIDVFREFTGVSSQQMLGRKKPTAGDKGTNLKIKGLKKGRMRDFPENRLDELMQWDGLLHTHMAITDMIMRAHWGRTDGLDPASLCKFATALGRSWVKQLKAEFNASRRIQRCQWKGMMLAVFAKEMGCASYSEVEVRLRDPDFNWGEAIENLVDTFCLLRKVSVMRKAALDRAEIA